MRIHATIGCLIFCLSFNLAFADSGTDRVEQLKTMLKGFDVEISFYGTVKDQYGQAVDNATVFANYEYFSLTDSLYKGINDVTAHTDLSGNFVFKGVKGKRLYLYKIVKEGYLFNQLGNSYDYGGVDERHKFIPDKNNPVVFILRKNPTPGLIAEKTSTQIISNRGEVYYLDLLNGFMHLEKWMKKIDSDMVLTVKTSDNGATFKIDLKTTDNNSGLVCNESVPFIAPDSGYQREISFSISKGPEIKKNIYYRGTKGEYGEIFARLEIQSHLGRGGLDFAPALYTNLEGSKNLEYDSKYTLMELSKIGGTHIELQASDEFKAAVLKALINARQKREQGK